MPLPLPGRLSVLLIYLFIILSHISYIFVYCFVNLYHAHGFREFLWADIMGVDGKTVCVS